ncbi:MAG: alginate export family protein [Prolixibacteraceae bacterium]|nr:alginate export family protein [Prolixibacteraceae bacterium]
MRKVYALAILGLLFLLSFSESYGQTTIDAEFRPRSEFRQGFNQPLPDTLKPAFVTMQRTRLNFNYKGGILSARLTLQDSRVFGETNTRQPASATTGSLGIYEAWSELLLMSGTSFKIGRQGVQFEDGRLFSLSNWSNTGNAHDLAQVRYFALGLDVQLGYAYNNQKAYFVDTSYYSVSLMYKQLAYLHLTKTIVPGLDLSLLGVDEGFVTSKKDLDLYHRYTAGGTLLLKKDKLPLGIFATGYYQFGKSTPTVDLSAYLLAMKATYAFTDKIGGLAGIDYYSGSESTLEATKNNTWNKLLYGVSHSFNGYMEYWAALPKGGLVNYFGGVNLTLSKKLSSEITYYGFSLAKDMKVGKVNVEKNLGSEIDVVLNYKFSPEAAIQFGWCTYIVTDGTEMLKFKSTAVDTKFPQYAYLMLTIRPQFYKTPVVAESK